MAKTKMLNEKTPNGGVRSEVLFTDEDGDLVDESEATGATIIEYAENGEEIFRTYGKISKTAI